MDTFEVKAASVGKNRHFQVKHKNTSIYGYGI